MRSIVETSIVAGLVLALVACGPTRPRALDRAHDDYALAAADPEIASRAPVPLDEAHRALVRAEDVWRDDEDEAETAHLAHLALQHVEIARARARAQAARETAGTVVTRERRAVAREDGREIERGHVWAYDDGAFAGPALRADAHDRLDEVVDFLREHPDRKVLIEGHAVGGSAEGGERLARGRADAVEAALVRQGVDASRITTRAYGETARDVDRAMADERVDVVVLRPGEIAPDWRAR